MKKINYVVWSIAIAIALTGCKKEEPATIPALSTTPASNITASTAVSGGSILDDGGANVIANGVCWSINPNPSTLESKTVDGVGAAQFISNINGLSAGSTYHIRAYATNSVGTAYGADITFTTLGEAPSCLTQAATNISTNGATLNGTVNPNHLSTVVTFEYGINTSYGSNVTATQSPMTGNAILNANAAITGLMPGTIYHFRIKTVNSIGTVYGEDLTFTTTGIAPAAITYDATNVTGTTATLNGKVNANSISTTVTFEYGTTTSYGNNVNASPGTVSGNAETGVSYNLTGLALGTTYHYRVRAQNSVGVTYGSDKSFTTPNKPTVTTVAITDKTYNSAVSGGTIVSDGGAAITAKGVCWNTTGSPTISGSKTNEGAGNAAYVSNLTGLLPNTTYYIRAYATNSAGTGYGNTDSFITPPAPVADIQGNIYSTVRIGDQIWMAEDLKVTKYRDGSDIPNVTGTTQWVSLTSGAYCDLNNDPEWSETYGKLYNFFVVLNNKGICPTGWHVPNDVEIATLINYLGGPEVAGGKIKEVGFEHWESPNTGATNLSGFTALGSGHRHWNGGFSYPKIIFEMWLSNERASRDGHRIGSTTGIWNNTQELPLPTNDGIYAEDGCSIRCIKD